MATGPPTRSEGGQGRLDGPPGAVPVQAGQQLDALEELLGVHAACIVPDRLWAVPSLEGASGLLAKLGYNGRIPDKSQTRGLSGMTRSKTPGRDRLSSAKRVPSRSPR